MGKIGFLLRLFGHTRFCLALGSVILLSSCELVDGTALLPTSSSSTSTQNTGSQSDDEVDPLVASSIYSSMSISTNKCIQGETGSITATLQLKNGNNENLTTGGDTVYIISQGGSAVATPSSTTDNGDGTYTATIDCTTFGTNTYVSASVNGINLAGVKPALTINLGDYKRTITLSSATEVANFPVRLEINMSNFTYANANASGDDLRFVDSNENVLDYWLQQWDPTGTSIIWVDVLNSGTSQFDMYYGNTYLSAASSASGVFQTTTQRDLYVEVSSTGGAGGQSTNIVSYFDNTSFTVEENGGSTGGNLNSYGLSNFTNLIQGLISSNAPLGGRALNFNNAFDAIMPLSFASTRLGYADSRGTEKWEFYNPSADNTANITIRNYNASGTELGTDTLAINPGEYGTTTFTVSPYGLVESDVKIVGFVSNSGNTDALPLIPGGTEVFGVNSNGGSLGILEDGTTGTIYYSGAASVPFTGDKGDVITFSAGGSHGNARAVRVSSDKPIVANAQADGDGSEASSFYPLERLDSVYMIPGDAQYVSVACPYATTVFIYNPDQTLNTSLACTPSGNDPGFAFFGSTSNGTQFAQGSRIQADRVFHAYYEYNSEDETNLTGPSHAIPYVETDITLTLGSEETL